MRLTRCQREPHLRETVIRESDLLRRKDELILQKDILTKESEHRLLNGLQLITSLLALQSRATTNAEVLNGELFDTLKEAQIMIEICRKYYNKVRHTRRWDADPGTRGNRLAGKTRSANVSAKLTFQADHSAVAGHSEANLFQTRSARLKS